MKIKNFITQKISKQTKHIRRDAPKHIAFQQSQRLRFAIFLGPQNGAATVKSMSFAFFFFPKKNENSKKLCNTKKIIHKRRIRIKKIIMYRLLTDSVSNTDPFTDGNATHWHCATQRLVKDGDVCEGATDRSCASD